MLVANNANSVSQRLMLVYADSDDDEELDDVDALEEEEAEAFV